MRIFYFWVTLEKAILFIIKVIQFGLPITVRGRRRTHHHRGGLLLLCCHPSSNPPWRPLRLGFSPCRTLRNTSNRRGFSNENPSHMSLWTNLTHGRQSAVEMEGHAAAAQERPRPFPIEEKHPAGLFTDRRSLENSVPPLVGENG